MSAKEEPKKEKSKEELEKEQEEAKEQVNALLARSAPKNLRQGVSSGLSNIMVGAVGGVGVIVLAPVMGLAVGTKSGGIIGGAVGFTGGAVIGVLGGAALMVGGTVQGVIQLGRGVAAVPNAVIQPRRGKWWNEAEGKWILTNLEDEAKALEGVPADDDDILGEAKKDAESSGDGDGGEKGEVVDPYYYDVLGVDTNAEPSKIKRQYYVLARKYHPDKVGADDKEAADKFKDIAEAYQVLSDPDLRAKYDKEGRDGLSADKTETVDGQPKVDPAILFAFLFGSDKFNDYVGRLAMATSASIADSPKIGVKDARKLQARRCTRLAIALAERLRSWTSEDYELAKTTWTTEAADLSTASYGSELVHLIGKVYTLAAVQFIGSIDAGIGMPSISKWAASHHAAMKKSHEGTKQQMDTLKAGMKMMEMNKKAAAAMEEAKTDEEKAEVEKSLENEMFGGLLQVMWLTTVVDITNTLHETVQMTLFDKSVDDKTRKARAHGLKQLGEIFMECPAVESDTPEDAKRMYEEAAFAAMLETIKRKDEATHAAATGK